MLNCVYHPVDEMRVVDDEDRQRLLETGYWFDTPAEAKQKRDTYEKRISEKRRKRSKSGKDEQHVECGA